MKAYLAILGLLVAISPFSTFAADKGTLQSRLNKINAFYAQFEQTVSTPENMVIQEGKGELRLKKTRFFNWHMTEPEETQLISNGNIVWMYTPQIEQVTISTLDSVTDNALLLLITERNAAEWDQYTVKQTGNRFVLTPITRDKQTFDITLLNNGIISAFTINETDGQKSQYTFTHQSLTMFDDRYFTFTPPKGVTIDDQR